jgi:Sec-independent protein translocase protein TatA
VDLIIALVIVLIIVVIWRGPKTIPEIGRMFGRGVREARAEAAKLRSDDAPPVDDRMDLGGPGGDRPGA